MRLVKYFPLNRDALPSLMTSVGLSRQKLPLLVWVGENRFFKSAVSRLERSNRWVSFLERGQVRFRISEEFGENC